MNRLSAFWRHSGLRALCTSLVGLLGGSLLALVGAPLMLAAATGLGLMIVFEIHERVVLFPLWRRVFKTGRGAAGDWMSPLEMRPYLRPLPKEMK